MKYIHLFLTLDKLSAAFQAGGGYETDTNKNKVCNGLSIPQDMRERPFDMLSGGEKTRVKVVLPQPLGPSRPTRSPASTWKVSPSNIFTPE